MERWVEKNDFASFVVPRIEQELLTLPEHLSSPPDFSAVRVARSSVFCVMFCRSFFVFFLLTIVLSVLRLTVSVPLWYLQTFLVVITMLPKERPVKNAMIRHSF
jgi:type IV secretory pathway component VirB8